MTLSKIWEKLRKKNKNQYRQLLFCVGFAMMLITSYLMMLMSPLIQQTLPEGGDSRKQVYMIFALAAVGCIVFVSYAAGLFLRYKSRETGVLLALGADKKHVGRALKADIVRCGALSMAAGLLGGCILSWIIGTAFKAVMSEVTDQSFSFTLPGIILSIVYALILMGLLMVLTSRFMKRSNIMDILNEQRKQEPLRKMVSSAYLVRGIIFLLAGVLLGFVMPTVVVNLTKHYLGAWTNLFYLLALVGLYQLLVYSVSCHKRGRHSQRYYSNLVSYGMLKFQGRSIVRNMLVITLLLLGGLFAVFYVPTNNAAMSSSLSAYESMYGYYYTDDMDPITQDDVEKIASDYGVTVENYRQATMIQAVGSGVNRDDTDDNGDLIEIYEDRHCLYEFISASDYQHLSGQQVDIEPGTYRLIQLPDSQENLFFRFDDMDKVYLDRTNTFMPMEYAGNLTYVSLVQGRGFDYEARMVVNDSDFQRIMDGTALFPEETQVLFDSRGGDELEFSRELYRQFGSSIPEDMKVSGSYDFWAKMQADEAGEEYGYDGIFTYDPDNPVKEADWLYEPHFIPMEEAYATASYAVYLMLFVYVAIVCLAAVGIISWSRSRSVGLSNAPVLSDLRKLGADRIYLRMLLRQQIKKVYVLPTIIGCVGMLAFELLLLNMNDGRLDSSELLTMAVCCLVALAAALYQYLLYRFSLKNVTGMLGLG